MKKRKADKILQLLPQGHRDKSEEISTDQLDSVELATLKKIFKDFTSDRSKTGFWAGSENRVCGGLTDLLSKKENPLRKMLPPAHMVFLTLVHILGFEFYGPGEKVLWIIPIFYKGIPIQLSFRKFGFCVETADPESEKTRNLVREVLSKLLQGIAITERLLEPVIESQIRSGNVTIQNQFYNLDRMYRFFREKAELSYSTPPPKPKVNRDKDGRVVSKSFDPVRPEREALYYSYAMLDLYFSRLEHMLVLLLAFIDYNPKNDDLVLFIGTNWSDKFKRVVDLGTNKDRKMLYDELKHIKEQFLNTVAHGWFEKHGASLHFHVPLLGAVPVRMSKSATAVRYSLYHLDVVSFQKMSGLLDKVDALLESSPGIKYGLKFLRSGLDISFAEESRKLYRDAMSSESSFDALIEHLTYVNDTYANMDF